MFSFYYYSPEAPIDVVLSEVKHLAPEQRVFANSCNRHLQNLSFNLDMIRASDFFSERSNDQGKGNRTPLEVSKMKFSGRLSNYQRSNETDRVVAVGEGQSLLNEAPVQQEGQWSLEVVEPVRWIVAQQSGLRLAAAATQPDSIEPIQMPDLVRLRLEFENQIPGGLLWLNPLELEGFPQELLWVLQAHPDSTIDLNVGELPITGKFLEVYVQRGKYKLSGGRLALHPVPSEKQGTVLLERVTDGKTKTSVEAVNGAVVIEVYEDASYQLYFAPVNP